MLKKGTMAYYSRLYDTLYEIGQRILDNHNPCQINNGKCTGLSNDFCCQGCSCLTSKGCRAKALWCKLWLCGSKEYINTINAWEAGYTTSAKKLRVIRQLVWLMFPISRNGRITKTKFMQLISAHKRIHDAKKARST